MEVVAGTYHVEVAGGRLECSLPGRVKRSSARFVSVGDLVEVEQLEDGSCRIAEPLPRQSALTRHGVARRREQVIVANVDQVAAVVAVTRPDPDFSMVDRLLALAELNEVTGLVIVNKADLLNDFVEPGPAAPQDPLDTAVPKDFRPYVDAGYDVLLTSAAYGVGLPQLRARLADRITVFSGPSGVGKSSLLNALMPGLDLRVGEVGERKGRGRHTTVAAALYPFRDGGYVADTPGLQYVALWEVDPADLTHAFPEFTEPAAGCRFANCRHRDEPDCDVRAAVDAGSVSERRYKHYLALLAEAEEGR
jgi:ribosome biogenesis GTPase